VIISEAVEAHYLIGHSVKDFEVCALLKTGSQFVRSGVLYITSHLLSQISALIIARPILNQALLQILPRPT